MRFRRHGSVGQPTSQLRFLQKNPETPRNDIRLFGFLPCAAAWAPIESSLNEVFTL